MTAENIEQARSAIATEIGPDVGEFTPAGEKHLFGWDDMLVLGGAFLIAYLKGFVEGVGGQAGKKSGEALVDYLVDQVKVWRGKSSEEQSTATQHTADAAEKTVSADPKLAATVFAAVQKALASALANEAESDIAHRIADRVSQEAMKILLLDKAA